MKNKKVLLAGVIGLLLVALALSSCGLDSGETNEVSDEARENFINGLLEAEGAKIAFLGISTPKTITTSTPTYFQNEAGEYIYGFCQGEEGAELYNAVQASVDAARAEGA